MGTYNYVHLMEYLPKRYSATYQQECDRKSIYDFKDGYCSTKIKMQLVEMIKKIIMLEPNKEWCICFIPASTHFKTQRRYSELARYLIRETGCSCSINTISTLHDEEAGHIIGKKNNPADNFSVHETDIKDKNVILIDDIITRGNTFVYTADKLVMKGASFVLGLFIAKTVNPDWHSRSVA